MNKEKKLRVLGRGLGNIASQVIILSKKYFPGLLDVPHMIIRYDEVTIQNLHHLTKYLPETQLLLVGDSSKEIEEVRSIHSNVKFISSVELCVKDYDVALDFTEDSRSMVKFVNDQIPLIVHCEQASLGPNQLYVPPMWGAKPEERSMVFRTIDCLLSGTAPFIAKIAPLIDVFHSINFITHLGGEFRADKKHQANYFSNTLTRKKARDFSEILKKDCIVSLVSKPNNGPFYSASFSCKINKERVESVYGNMQNFDKWAFEPMLQGVGRITTSRADSSDEYVVNDMYLNADQIDKYLEKKLSDGSLKSPIVFFKRSFLRDGDTCSFSLGFDTTFAPGLAVIDVLYMLSKYGVLPLTPTFVDKSMSEVDGVLFKNESKVLFDQKTFAERSGEFGDLSVFNQNS